MKAQAGVGESDIGLALLGLGIASVTGLAASRRLMGRFSSARVLATTTAAAICLMPVIGSSLSRLQLFASFAASGFLIALIDVGMNPPALTAEISGRIRRIGRLQACYSAGGILGALLGSALAAAGLSPLWSFLLFSSVALAGWTCGARRLRLDILSTGRRQTPRLPLFVWFCGLMIICAIAGEGAIGDWGSIFLHQEKGAAKGLAALGYGVCAVAMASVRLAVDSLRARVGDAALLAAGIAISVLGFAAAILSPSPWGAIAGFALTGAGIAPAAPVIMSRAGSFPGVDPGHACAAVSMAGYGSLLVLPPALGFVGEGMGLGAAFLIPASLCVLHHPLDGGKPLRRRRGMPSNLFPNK